MDRSSVVPLLGSGDLDEHCPRMPSTVVFVEVLQIVTVFSQLYLQVYLFSLFCYVAFVSSGRHSPLLCLHYQRTNNAILYVCIFASLRISLFVVYTLQENPLFLSFQAYSTTTSCQPSTCLLGQSSSSSHLVASSLLSIFQLA